MNKRAIRAALLSLFLAGGAFGQAMRTGQSVGVSGSGTMTMYGAQAVGWNPANLGLRANPAATFSFASASMSFGNNAFSPEYIGNTFVEGDTLDDNQIADILGQMDADQLDLYGLFGVPVVGLSIGRYAVNVDAHALLTASIPADIFELVLTGPVKNVPYDLSTVEESSIGYGSISFSAAQPLHILPMLDEFAVGATFKYLIGAGYAELEHKEGTLLVTDEVIHADGFYRFLNSTKGDGVGLDLGAAGHSEPLNLYIGATLGNLIGTITWDEVEASETQFYRHEGVDMDSVSKNEYWKNFLTQSDVKYDFGSVKTSLPKYLMLSADRPYMDGRGDLLFSYFQGLNETPGQSTTPRVSFGTEFRWVPILPLRAGVAFGGIEGSEYSAGFGLKLLGWQMHLGASWQRGLLAGAEGFSVAITNYFGPSFKR